MKIRRYSDLKRFNTFEERFEYLKLNGIVGEDTFGFDRYLNQILYRSYEWKKVRDIVILRDYGCDLGIIDREIHDRIIIHHMNPVEKEELLDHSEVLLNPEFLITTSHMTHNALHYGDYSLVEFNVIERAPNDTCPWRL